MTNLSEEQKIVKRWVEQQYKKLFGESLEKKIPEENDQEEDIYRRGFSGVTQNLNDLLEGIQRYENSDRLFNSVNTSLPNEKIY